MVDIARRESAPDDVRAAHDLLVAVDQHGGVFTSSMVTLVPRVLGVAMDLLGEEPQAKRAVRDRDGREGPGQHGGRSCAH